MENLITSFQPYVEVQEKVLSDKLWIDGQEHDIVETVEITKYPSPYKYQTTTDIPGSYIPYTIKSTTVSFRQAVKNLY